MSCGHAKKQNSSQFAAHTSPTQYALGIPGGIDLILHTAMIQMNTYIKRTPQDFRKCNLPTGIKALLDQPLFLLPYPQCRCGNTVGPYGNHIYNCPQYAYPRDNIHDNFRNAAYHVLRTLAPLAGFIAETQDVLHEPDNIISENPLLRPADTALAHKSVSNQDISYTLIDYSTAVKALQIPSSPHPLQPHNPPPNR